MCDRVIGVIVEWNTDGEGNWIEVEDRPVMPDDLNFTYPLSIYGPFETMDAASKWMEDALPDNMDVFEMYALESAFPKDWPLASPTEYPDGYYRPEGQHPDAIIGIVQEAPMPLLNGKVGP